MKKKFNSKIAKIIYHTSVLFLGNSFIFHIHSRRIRKGFFKLLGGEIGKGSFFFVDVSLVG